MTFEIKTLRIGFYVRTPRGFRNFFEVALEDVADSLDEGKFDGLEVIPFVEATLRLHPLRARYLKVTSGVGDNMFIPAEGLVPENWYPVYACNQETPLEAGDIAKLFKENPGAFEVSSGGAKFRALTLAALEAVPKSLTASYLRSVKGDTMKANLACKAAASFETDTVSFNYAAEKSISTIDQVIPFNGCFAGLDLLTPKYTIRRRKFATSVLRGLK